jgi:hypothetical protein
MLGNKKSFSSSVSRRRFEGRRGGLRTGNTNHSFSPGITDEKEYGRFPAGKEIPLHGRQKSVVSDFDEIDAHSEFDDLKTINN